MDSIDAERSSGDDGYDFTCTQSLADPPFEDVLCSDELKRAMPYEVGDRTGSLKLTDPSAFLPPYWSQEIPERLSL